MSERMTSILLPGSGWVGVADYGRKDAPAMIAQAREQAARDLATAQAVLDADDEDFRVETYVGINAQRRHEIVQPGKLRADR